MPAGRIEEVFAAYFADWHIVLPADALAKGECGAVRAAGWSIRYMVGRDEQGEFLDCFATHRMTNDRHVRIYDDGRTVDLPTLDEFRRVGDTPDEDARLECEYVEKNRRVSAMLDAKGFGLGPQ